MFLLGVLILSLSPVIPYASAVDYGFTLTVKDEGGSPLEGVDVQILNYTGQVLSSGSTDSSGQYTDNIGNGSNYLLTISSDSYLPAEVLFNLNNTLSLEIPLMSLTFTTDVNLLILFLGAVLFTLYGFMGERNEDASQIFTGSGLGLVFWIGTLGQFWISSDGSENMILSWVFLGPIILNIVLIIHGAFLQGYGLDKTDPFDRI